MTNASESMAAGKGRRVPWPWLGALLLAAIVLTVFWRATRGEFLLWDDNISLYENPHLGALTPARVAWAFTDAAQTLRYMPLSWLAYSAIFSVGGLEPFYFHAAVVLAHVVNGLLLYVALRKLLRLARPDVDERWRECAAWFAAALWALHPLRVEVVAWALTLTYALAWMGLLGTLIILLKGWETRSARWLGAGVVTYTIALLIYPVGLTAWIAWALLGGWLARARQQPRRASIGWLLALATPAVLVGGVTLWARAHSSGAWQGLPAVTQISLIDRGAQALYLWSYYVWRPWWPVQLAPIYGTLLEIEPGAARFLASAGFVIAITAAAGWRWRRQRRSGFGLWWLATLAVALPVSGLTEHPFFPSDRYTGLPGIVLALALAVAASDVRRPAARWMLALAGGALAVGCAVLSRRQIEPWHDTTALFTYTATTTENPSVRAECYLRRGLAAEAVGRRDLAQQECARGLAQDPTHRNLRALEARLQLPPPALPLGADAQIQLAREAARQGDAWASEAHLRRAVALAPSEGEPRVRLALALSAANQPREALSHFLWARGSGRAELDRAFFESLEASARAGGDDALARAVRRKLSQPAN